ncbi:MAG: alpha/beta hydrolase, partial [Bacteroidales bacterium]|nr:alpha/beta hydrolase [Bacteroidales bacterium]
MINSLIKFNIVLISVILYCSYSHAQYKSDELDNGLLCRTIDMPDDYEGKVVCTLIKRDCEQKSKKALLYVHGFNDYFFQAEMADRFNAEGYNFYAVDL